MPFDLKEGLDATIFVGTDGLDRSMNGRGAGPAPLLSSREHPTLPLAPPKRSQGDAATTRDDSLRPAQSEAILERVLRAYHRDERHGGADWIGRRVLDAELVPVAREAFVEADDMPPDHEVLQALDGGGMRLLGEGYHVMALAEPGDRFVAKYVKHANGVPPLAPPREQPPREGWAHDHGVRPDGSLHPAIWQHIRSFEAYGPLAVPNRVYLAETACEALNGDERRQLDRFRSIGIVRSLGGGPRTIPVHYPDGFPDEKRAADGVAVSVLVIQALVTPLIVAVERTLRAGDIAAARDMEARYRRFLEELWRYGVSHLDFSILNVGVTGCGEHERLQIFDPHMGVIENTGGDAEVQDPLAARLPGHRSLEDLLRAARDGSRWALWRVQENAAASNDLPQERAAAATELVRDFHIASGRIAGGEGPFSLNHFGRTWQRRGAHGINSVLHAELWTLLRHPLSGLIQSMLEGPRRDAIHDRTLTVLGIHDDRPLAQFRAASRVYRHRPVILIANVADEGPKLAKHWGRVRLPPEVDVQDDPAIHYHLRDLFTGETYVRSGEDLARRGFVFGLAPFGIHVLEVEDVIVHDLAVERAVAAHGDVSALLRTCTRRVGVVGDVHGELHALREVLRALGFIDSSDQWTAGDGTLVFTGDVGHGRHLQEVFDFIRRLAAHAHAAGGKIVWTLGNHDLYVDGEGGQGGEGSLGYRLWPTVREAALHPERSPGLAVRAAYFDHGKLFVHGGILPNIIELALREGDARDASEIASYVNDVLHRALVERERITSRDLPHEIFRTGTSHARRPRFPGEIGYEPAGIFTPDLREVDHYRYHRGLLPQIIGHTASKNGEIRYSPGSWLRRDYIAIDVGRQHGTGNGGLLLTDFGWVAVTPGEGARLVEVAPLFVRLARDATGEKEPAARREIHATRVLAGYFRIAKPGSGRLAEVRDDPFEDLSPAQLVARERLLATIRRTGRCLIVTDLDAVLTAFFGGDFEHSTSKVLADYAAAGGVLVFASGAPFHWFYYRFLRPLLVDLGLREQALGSILLVLSGGKEIYVFQDGAYRLVSRGAGKDASAAFDALMNLSRVQRLASVPELDPDDVVYVGSSQAPPGLDHAMLGRARITIDVGDAMLERHEQFIVNLHRGYLRMIDLIITATDALKGSGLAKPPEAPPEVGDTALWTFERKRFRRGHRLRVRVGGSGYVHAGVAHADGRWDPVYDVPLMPRPGGSYEAVLPPGVDAFTFFWTEPPRSPGHPGHWEREPSVFTAEPWAGESTSRGGIRRDPSPVAP